MNQQNDQQNQQPEQQNRMNPNQQQINGQQAQQSQYGQEQRNRVPGQQPEPQGMERKGQQPDVKRGESDENFEKQAQTERPESNPKEFVRKDGRNQDQETDRSDRLN